MSRHGFGVSLWTAQLKLSLVSFGMRCSAMHSEHAYGSNMLQFFFAILFYRTFSPNPIHCRQDGKNSVMSSRSKITFGRRSTAGQAIRGATPTLLACPSAKLRWNSRLLSVLNTSPGSLFTTCARTLQTLAVQIWMIPAKG